MGLNVLEVEETVRELIVAADRLVGVAARLLAREEAEAARKTMLQVRDDGEGLCHGSFRIPTLHGGMLAKYLDALASPRRPDAIDRRVTGGDGKEGPTKHSSEVLGEAFCQLIERFPANRLPTAGGVNATVVVTIPIEALLSGLGAASLDTGGSLSVGAVRRLACQAGVVPAVLGTKSEILDAGRKARSHSPIQRIMLGVRDEGCTAVGCDRPAGWCDAHHDIPFSQVGPTDVKHGRLLCARHHTLIHSPGYTASTASDGKVRITRAVKRQ